MLGSFCFLISYWALLCLIVDCLIFYWALLCLIVDCLISYWVLLCLIVDCLYFLLGSFVSYF